ncbi:hypothetical protein CVD25_17185 [Bacillus canaveralius]|uniref:DUF1641 domain-containing protein n=2 Tax=Bacillus canaveralius TaxID=1403243 RepID=A0A2N5GSU7_9BACI|nr:DUF1641 domain-containing protein [Bacillus canaveralius]PLR86845.1 hypothetical protein CU635_00725 [Bacillus canaveralius]PLR93333.1 hypothetical protein CVD25_17185 [Bacillus canaveralius]
MAKAIKKIHRIEVNEQEKRKKDLREVEDALIDNKEAILQSLQVLHHMHERGILSVLNGLLGQGDRVLNILVKAADKPENTNAIKNLLLMVGTLGMINVQQLEPFLLKVDAGIARVAKHANTEEKTSYFDLVGALKDPEINRAVTLLLNFLKGMGQDTEEFERNTDGASPAQQQKYGETLE